MKNFSVSLLYLKTDRSAADYKLLAMLTDATSGEEALGKAIKYFDGETKDFLLGAKVVLEIKLS
jgi:hypothetical protein